MRIVCWIKRKQESRDTKEVKVISESSIYTNLRVLLKIIIEVSFFMSAIYSNSILILVPYPIRVLSLKGE